MRGSKDSRTASNHTIQLSAVILFVFLGVSARSVLAQCLNALADPPTAITEVDVTDSGQVGDRASVAIRGNGDFVIAWEEILDPTIQSGNQIFVRRYDAEGVEICNAGAGDLCPTPIANNPTAPFGFHKFPSISMNAEGLVYVAWIGSRTITFGSLPERRMSNTFDFDLSPFVPTPSGPSVAAAGPGDQEPSAGFDSNELPVVTWMRRRDYTAPVTDDPLGALYARDPDPAQDPIPLSCCINSCDNPNCFMAQWQPCAAMREDGYFVIAWAKNETDEQDSRFDIVVQLFDQEGGGIGSSVIVNDPSAEIEPSNQLSPAVAFDADGRIVVTWVGPSLNNCEVEPFRIFARRLSWDGQETSPIVAVSDPFLVDSCTDYHPIDATAANPTVALSMSQEAGQAGRFIIAWNVETEPPLGVTNAVHAQYFECDGQPLGREFRVHEAFEDPEEDEFFHSRRIANSSAHTMVYGPDGQVIVAWTRYDHTGDEEAVAFTMLPPDYAEALAEATPCVKGGRQSGRRCERSRYPAVDRSVVG